MSKGFSGLGETSASGNSTSGTWVSAPMQLVGGVAVLAGVEHRFAAQDRHEGLQLGPVPGRPHRRVAQHQQARVDRARRRRPPPAPPSRAAQQSDRARVLSRCVATKRERSCRRARRAAAGSRPASPAGRRSSAPWPASTRRCSAARRGRGRRRRRARSARRSRAGAATRRRRGARASTPIARRQAGQLGAAGGVEPVVGRRPDAERLERRDRPVGVRPGHLVEAVDEGEGTDQGQHAPSTASTSDRQQRPPAAAGCAAAPAAPAPAAPRARSAPQRTTIATGQASPAKL